MSISVTAYSPMCLDPRHYLFLLPVVSIPAAIIINAYVETKNNKWLTILFFATVAIVSLPSEGEWFKFLYFPLFILVFVYSMIPICRLSQMIFVVALGIILSVKSLSMIHYAQKVNYNKQKEIFTEVVMKKGMNMTVITNDVQKRLGDYYNGFSSKEGVSILTYNNFIYDSLDTTNKLLYLNWYTVSIGCH